MGGKNSPPPPPDYGPIAAASQKSADQAFALGQDQLAWAKEQYAQDSKTVAPLIQGMTDTQKQAADFAQQQQDFYTGTYKPIEQQFAADAQNWDSPDREQQQAGQAEAGVNQQFDQARTAATQQLESFGIDPSATRYGALDIGTRTAQAAASAAAGTGAIQNTQQQGMQLKQSAINVGRGYPGAIAGGQGVGTGAGSAAIGGTNSTTATGASTMGTAPQYMGLGNQALAGWGNTLNMGYSNQLAAFNAENNQSSGWGSALGLIGGALLPKFAEGGAVPAGATQGGAIPTSASPTGGQAIDDVPARLTPGEFVVPKDAVSWLGEKHFQDLIKKSREARQQVQAKPEIRPAINAPPTFASRPMAGAIPA